MGIKRANPSELQEKPKENEPDDDEPTVLAFDEGMIEDEKRSKELSDQNPKKKTIRAKTVIKTEPEKVPEYIITILKSIVESQWNRFNRPNQKFGWKDSCKILNDYFKLNLTLVDALKKLKPETNQPTEIPK